MNMFIPLILKIDSKIVPKINKYCCLYTESIFITEYISLQTSLGWNAALKQNKTNDSN